MPAAATKHIAITSILLALATTAVAFRFLTHRRVGTKPGIDDWTLLAALALVFAIYVEGLVCKFFVQMLWLSDMPQPDFLDRGSLWRCWKTHHGAFAVANHHFPQSMPLPGRCGRGRRVDSRQCFAICYVTYGATFVVTKVSILLFYIRVFPLRGLRIACAIVGCLAITLGMSICIVGGLMCRPLAYTWNKNIVGGKCLPRHAIFYIPAVPTLLLNAVIVCLPMPTIWRLQMKRAHRIAVIAVFALGAM